MGSISNLAAKAASVAPRMAHAAVHARLQTLRADDPRAIGDGLIDWRDEVQAIRQHELLVRHTEAALRAIDPAGEWFRSAWAAGVRLGAEFAADIDGTEADLYEVATTHVLTAVVRAVWNEEQQ
jgi:hypothetical protein